MNPRSDMLIKQKSAGSIPIAHPAAKGLRIARKRGTSNAEPTRYGNTLHADMPNRHIPHGAYVHTKIDIYHCFILGVF